MVLAKFQGSFGLLNLAMAMVAGLFPSVAAHKR